MRAERKLSASSPAAQAQRLALRVRATIRTKPTDRKKTWGIFYTPTDLSRCLVNWAIVSRNDRVLEPSFGGCGFLEESAKVLQEHGATNPWRQLCGCDKDLQAFEHLPPAYRQPNRGRRFLHQNFLNTKPADYCVRQFNVVVGNPPYVSRHNMRKYQIESADSVLRRDRVAISRRASLWAYFILHSFKFLRVGGRMAWVLPRSLSQSDYGRGVVAALCRHFDDVSIVSLQHRFFATAGADEVVDILVCSGFAPEARTTVCSPSISYANSLAELKERLARSGQQCALPVSITSAREDLLTLEERQALDRYGEIVGSRRLGDIAHIKIGIVTGATRFFVLKASALAAANLTRRSCRPLLTTATSVKGLAWLAADEADAITSDERILLVRPGLKETKSYWARFPVMRRESISTFGKRLLWNDPDDGRIPAAFCFSLVQDGPRLVANTAGINSNNSVYRVYFKEQLADEDIRMLGLLLLSSFSQTHGELTGRVCGGGGLKFEPSDAAKLRIPNLPPGFGARFAGVWSQVDLLVRNGQETEAIRCVDAVIQECWNPQLSVETLATVQGLLKKLRNARRLKVET